MIRESYASFLILFEMSGHRGTTVVFYGSLLLCHVNSVFYCFSVCPLYALITGPTEVQQPPGSDETCPTVCLSAVPTEPDGAF